MWERLRRVTGLGRAELVGFAFIWPLYALLVRRHWFVTEDAFISFRYSRYWAHGHGLRYNLDGLRPVEGYTNFLWVAVCAIVERLGGAAPDWAPRISFVIASVLLFWVLRTLRVAIGVSALGSVVATAALALFPPYFVWSTSGLETAAFMAVVFVTLERMALRPEAPALAGGAVAGVALTLVRAEGIAWAFLIGGITVVIRRARHETWIRPVLVYGASTAGAFALMTIFRWVHFGALVPNTAYAKVGIGPATLLRGFQYLAVYLLTFPTLLLAMAAVPVHVRQGPRALALSLLVVVFAFYAYAVVIGGDFMTMGRVVLPTLPIVAIWAGVGFDSVASRTQSGRRYALLGAVTAIAVGILPAWDRHVVPEVLRAPFHFRHNRDTYHSEYWVWKLQRDNHYGMRDLGLALRAYAKPGDSFVTGVIGNVGYYSDVIIYDQYGLVTAEVGRLPLKESHLRSPGHDKYVPKSFFLKRRPTYWDAALFDVSGGERAVKWAAQSEDFGNKNGYVPACAVLKDGIWKTKPKLLCVIRNSADASAARVWRDFPDLVAKLR